MSWSIKSLYNGKEIERERHPRVSLALEANDGSTSAEEYIRLSIDSPYYDDEVPSSSPGDRVTGAREAPSPSTSSLKMNSTCRAPYAHLSALDLKLIHRLSPLRTKFTTPSKIEESSLVGSTDELWDHEVVELFLLDSKREAYLELEFGPHGHYLVLLLHGYRSRIKHMLELSYSASIDRDSSTWSGEALIPLSYLPPNVDKLNAYAIHGAGEKRVYEQLYPRTDSGPPDFHKLETFRPVDFSRFLPANFNTNKFSHIWK